MKIFPEAPTASVASPVFDESVVVEADDGERLHLSLSGQGTPILLLHGWTSSRASWAPLLPALSRRHRVICPDARGHGGHALRATPTPDVARLARDVLNLLDHFAIDQAVVVGHSMGALTLWQFLRDYGSARIAKLCILDQSPKLLTDADWQHGIYGDFDAARAQQLLADLQQDLPEAVLRLVACGLNDKAHSSYLRNGPGWRAMRDELRRLDPAPLIAIWNSLVAADFRQVLAQIDRPTLLVYGSASNFYTDACARYVAGQSRSAVLQRYAGADHGPHLMQPQRFLADFEALLATQESLR